MPELPEVETVVRDLRPHLLGSIIETVQFSNKRLRKPWNRSWTKQISGQKVTKLDRRGKWILISLQNDNQVVIHLGMTGQLQVMPVSQPHEDHVHMVMDLNADRQLRFRDIRRFGSVVLYASQSELKQFFTQCGLGPEPFHIDRDRWFHRLSTTSRNLKSILLDQKIVAGVGNIYADESLFQAKLHPAISGNQLQKKSADQLRKAVALVLERAINQRGSSIRNYIGGSGLKGRFQDEFNVYGRTGQSCFRCGSTIARIQLAGRSTHFCPGCQKLPIGSSDHNPVTG